MEAAWKIARGRLQIASGDDFERTALHYLRIIWPSMVQAPRLQRLDRYGVDLCVPDSDRHFGVVVQAKGFRIDEMLLEEQVRKQILPSIRKFRNSPLSCDKYVLLHNRNGSDRGLASLIQTELDHLVREHRAKSARLWDVFGFVKALRQPIDRLIREKLANRSKNLLRRQQSVFHFGDLFVSRVPVSRSTWHPQGPVQEDLDPTDFADTEAAKLISSARRVRYGMLIGAFGIGKTTTVLHAAELTGLRIIYVPASAIRREYGSQGTNYLLRNLNEELDLLDDLPADSAEVVGDLLGAAMSRVLRQPDSNFVLVLDGVDEHAFYGTPHGLKWLTNELAELQCPIVLTTRREHFLSLSGNYDLAMGELSKKGGAGRTVELMQLGPWSVDQARDLLKQAIDHTADQALSARLRRLEDHLAAGLSKLSASLLSHPLFLQMTLDLIVNGHEWLTDDIDRLIEFWVRQKIHRDLSVPRLHYTMPYSLEDYTEGMLASMSQIALDIHAQAEAGSGESINVQHVVATVRRIVQVPELDAATILTTSLLTPTRRRQGRVLEVKFFHQALQDFFLRNSSWF